MVTSKHSRSEIAGLDFVELSHLAKGRASPVAQQTPSSFEIKTAEACQANSGQTHFRPVCRSPADYCQLNQQLWR
jgi:hypothetical protein